jgi:Spy/CpxP family protein refolding chaperone
VVREDKAEKRSAPVSKTTARPFKRAAVLTVIFVKGAMMQKLGRLALVVAVVAMAASAALAQEQQRQRQRQRPGGGAGFGGGFGGTTFLLQQESVQKELKLSEEQVKKIKELSEKQRESFRGLRDLSQEERRTKMQEAVKANEKAVGEILKPEQLKRVKQISLQQQGARALSNPEIAKTLNLTSEQTDKIKKIQEEARAARGQRGQGRPDEEARKKLEEARKATNEKIMGVLTAEQKTKLKEMTGEPFKGEIRRPQFGGGNRPAGQGRRSANRPSA